MKFEVKETSGKDGGFQVGECFSCPSIQLPFHVSTMCVPNTISFRL
jgi:hypothetical protein